MSYYTARTNGNIDTNSLVGETKHGLICRTCNTLVDTVYFLQDGTSHCADCFKGDKRTLNKAWLEK